MVGGSGVVVGGDCEVVEGWVSEVVEGGGSEELVGVSKVVVGGSDVLVGVSGVVVGGASEVVEGGSLVGGVDGPRVADGSVDGTGVCEPGSLVNGSEKLRISAPRNCNATRRSADYELFLRETSSSYQ